MIRNVRGIGIVLIALCVMSAGCQALPLGGSQNPANPVIEDKIGKTGWWGWSNEPQSQMFSTIAARRMVLVTYTKDNTQYKMNVCTEPAPDASDDVASAIAGALTLAATLPTGVPTTGVPISAAGSMSSALTTLSKQLYKRAHGVQLYRDGAHYLCQRHMNGGFSDPATNEEIENEENKPIKDADKLKKLKEKRTSIEQKRLTEAYDNLLAVSTFLTWEEIKRMPLSLDSKEEQAAKAVLEPMKQAMETKQKEMFEDVRKLLEAVSGKKAEPTK